MGCRLKRSIYGLKQASRQWYLKFDQVLISYGYSENVADQCLYTRISGSHFAIIVLCVDDILIASNSAAMIEDIKRMLSDHFDMKDLVQAAYAWY